MLRYFDRLKLRIAREVDENPSDGAALRREAEAFVAEVRHQMRCGLAYPRLAYEPGLPRHDLVTSNVTDDNFSRLGGHVDQHDEVETVLVGGGPLNGELVDRAEEACPGGELVLLDNAVLADYGVGDVAAFSGAHQHHAVAAAALPRHSLALSSRDKPTVDVDAPPVVPSSRGARAAIRRAAS